MLDNSKYEQLLALLNKATELTAQFKGGYSGNFLSAEEFHEALGQSIIKIKAGDKREIDNLYTWFSPTSHWDDFTCGKGIDLGEKIFILVSDIRKTGNTIP